MMKRLLRGGARSSAPQHYSGARVVSARAFSHARSLTAAAVAVAMMASVAVTAFIPTYSANADQSKDDGAFATSNTIHMGDGSTDVNEADTGLATYVGRDFYVGAPTDGETGTADGSIHGSWAAEMEGQTFILGKYMQRALLLAVLLSQSRVPTRIYLVRVPPKLGSRQQAASTRRRALASAAITKALSEAIKPHCGACLLVVR